VVAVVAAVATAGKPVIAGAITIGESVVRITTVLSSNRMAECRCLLFRQDDKTWR
jgi:hypothetical protein